MYNRVMKAKGVLAMVLICFFCFCALGGMAGGAYADEEQSEIPEEKLKLVSENCDSIKTNLRGIQKSDARARVYMGAYYEKILTKYMTALNVKLVENNTPDTSLIESQNKYASAKASFAEDYITYQKKLEDLLSVDCKNDSKKFYEELMSVRKKQSIIVKDAKKLSNLLTEHKELVKKLEAKL